MFAIPQRDVNPLAHRLIERFGSLSAVLETAPSELKRVDGVGENAAVLLSLMPQLLSYYQHSAMGSKPVITNLAEARRYAGALFFGLHEERVYMICMDQSGRVLRPALLHKGTPVFGMSCTCRSTASTGFRTATTRPSSTPRRLSSGAIRPC